MQKLGSSCADSEGVQKNPLVVFVLRVRRAKQTGCSSTPKTLVCFGWLRAVGGILLAES